MENKRLTEIKFKYKKLHPDAKIQMPVFPGDVGYDVYATESKQIKPGEKAIINIGLAFEPPPGYYFTIETRSGHGINKNLRLHRGIIDNGFRKEVSVAVYNHGSYTYKILKGEKIAQLVLHPIIVFPLEEVKELSKTERGIKGFGSSGR